MMKTMKIFTHQCPRPRKLALLIGINYDRPEELTKELKDSYGKLRNPRKDIETLRKFLIERCEYDKSDIVTMLDGPNDVTLKPTENNIRQQITVLVGKAKPCDHVLFVFAGHSDQVVNQTGSEDDGQDEKLMALNGGLLDNELHSRLVNPLPAGTHLTAIFDTCHSGTMLDLKHYNCNKIYVPWISKGLRNTEKSSRCMVLTRKNAACAVDVSDLTSVMSLTSTPPISPVRAATLENGNSFARTQTYNSLVRVAIIARSKTETELQPRFKAKIAQLRDRLHFAEKRAQIPSVEENEKQTLEEFWKEKARVRVLSTPRAEEAVAQALKWTAELTEEPETLVKQCGGFNCRPAGPLDEQARTILSLAACNDDQQAWDSKRGSLIPMLIDYLSNENSSPTYRELLAKLSFQMHANTLELHKKSKTVHMKACRLARKKGEKHQNHRPTEQINFQDIVLGSERTLNLDDRFLI